MPKISAVLITLNEAHALPKTLDALAWADEIIIVDSGSSDTTVAIAEAAGCRVFFRAFDGFGTQKQFAVAQATHPWVLAIDADEVVSDSLRDEIQALLKTEPKHSGYYLPISLVFLGKVLRFGGEYRMKHLRLFDKRKGTFSADRVHEKVQIQGSIGALQQQVFHESYANLHDYIHKFNHYTSQAATQLAREKPRPSILKIILRFPLTFLKIYLVKGGFLDGYPGFIWAVLSGLYPMLKYAKQREAMPR